MELIAECATAHGGDLQLAEDMIAACADAGAHTVKFQSYSLEKLNPKDSQADWLKQAHLDRAAHERLIKACERHKVNFLSTPFDADSLQMLRDLGQKRFKIASSESSHDWWLSQLHERWYVSWPWGHVPTACDLRPPTMVNGYRLTAIPLYPTPLECVERARILDGWSDHGEGLAACYRALALGVQVLEVHVALAGRSRVTAFDKSPTELRMLRKFAEDCATMRSGVAQRFRERWTA